MNLLTSCEMEGNDSTHLLGPGTCLAHNDLLVAIMMTTMLKGKGLLVKCGHEEVL